MKLNPKKCTFGVEEGKFLGHIVTERGIKANPKKIQAIEDMASPKTKKEDFSWTEEAEAAFQDVKQLLRELPTLTAPIAGETLIQYIGISTEAISSILIAERNEVQMPIYFVTKLLQQSEINYPLIEKLVSKNFETLKVVKISRNKNKKADVLSKLATLTFYHLHKKVLVEVLEDKSIDEKVDGILTDDVIEARRKKVRAALYVLENGVLYRKSFNGPNLRCLAPQQAIDVVKEMHEVGPFPKSVGSARFLVVAIDFFTKWVEAKVYDLPNEIVSDNGKQFADNPFKTGIKARLGLSHTKWVDEVPYVLWAHRTTPKWSTGETPFSLVYGTDAVIPAEICVPTHRVLAFNVESNSSVLRDNLNLLEERRIMAAICQADAKQRMKKYYNKRVRHVQFKEGDLVLRDNEASRQAKQGKLRPQWEGPYTIIRAHPNGSYTIAAPFDEEMRRTWNAISLRKFYA
ncbi:uncharacterized protein [Rutidosis leptorrhynchoides]|uniref:uncharacterized protein n=1 Tax=Rutidosis leptorrhynchoides TaxID=125765 RepID=UPI003A9955E5